MNVQRFYTVTSLNRYLKQLIEEDTELSQLTLKGEISNFKRYPSGHIYFTLKDDESRLQAVMFSAYARGLSFPAKDGDEVIVSGSVNVYVASGQYQFIVQQMELFGLGKKLLELEQLKKKLMAEGLFDAERKRPIKTMPKAIGIITGDGSAALKDLQKNIHRRFPLVNLVILPSLVQGEGAPKEIIANIANAQKLSIDTLIIARGGGSNEDLSAFNDEGVVRAIAASKIPTVTAIGHEIDMTLADYASDKRVSTPTGAAEAVVPDQVDLIQSMQETYQRMEQALNQLVLRYEMKLDSLRKRPEEIMLKKLNDSFDKLGQIKSRPVIIQPSSIYTQKLKELLNIKTNLVSKLNLAIIAQEGTVQRLSTNLYNSMSNTLENNQQKLLGHKTHLRALSPLSVLDRGYSYMIDEQGNVISSIEQVERHQVVKTVLKNGKIVAQVLEKEKTDHGNETR